MGATGSRTRPRQLLTNPAAGLTQSGLIGTVVAHLNTFGNSLVGKYRGPDGAVAQLRPLPPSAMTVELRNGVPLYTYVDPFSGRRPTLLAADGDLPEVIEAAV